MKRLTATVPGSMRLDQDRAGSSGRLLWVLDGSTDPESDDGPGMFADGISEQLERIGREMEVYPSSRTPDLPEILAEAIGRNAHRETGFFATVAMSLHSDSATQTLVLGDTVALASSPGDADGRIFQPRVLADRRVLSVAETERSRLQQAVYEGASFEVVHCLQRELLSAERAMTNRDGGFWAVADDPRVATRALTGTYPPGTSVLLASDPVPVQFGNTAHRLMGAQDNRHLRDEMEGIHRYLAGFGPVGDMSAAVATPHGWGSW